ncbi:Uncharacterised protein [uncultured archaeon]|nr:Uncharacterised protein [uncultured archaeon]
MQKQKQPFGHHHPGTHKIQLPVGKIAAIVVVVLIAALAYYSFQPGAQAITSATTLSLQANRTTHFMIDGNTIALRLQSASSSGATFYASRLPVLYGPESVFTLYSGFGANVSSAGTSVADFNIRLASSGAGSASVTVTPLAGGLGIPASSSVTVTNPVIFGSNSQTAGNGPSTTVTTIPGSTTTLATTTSVDQAAANQQQALAKANSTTVGVLLSNLNVLFGKDTGCNSNSYNATYALYYHTLPPAPNSFANVSPTTPTGITVSASQLGSVTDFRVTYSTVSPSSMTSGPAVTMDVNTASGAITNVTYKGLYTGMSYSTLNHIYAFQSAITNQACAAFIAPTS